MKIGILETGRPPGTLTDQFGDYPAMFGQMLGEGFQLERFDVQAGELPRRPGAHDAYLITGSPAGVYDPLPWILPLQQFIRTAKNSKLVGICFGHQIMAEALGGHVEKSAKGWGAGLQHYAILRPEPWMGEFRPDLAAPASHQDQVVVQPPDTQVVAASSFTEFAALAWIDRPAICFQFHPEFSPAFAKALIEQRYDVVPDPEAAIASLDAPNDNARVAGWIRNFLNGESE
jgi:GMP synthase-like glutamine amidotransferase